MKTLSKTYNPQDTEEEIYRRWEESGYFNPDNLNLPADAPPYTIVLPPPNITDKLHLGHAAMLAIEDLLIRYHRLRGYRALWIPGTDHAAIATQNVVEKRLKEQGLTRHDLGREKFLKEVWKFLKKTQSTILKQTRRMGASLDWSREAFTLDEQRQKAVAQMFTDMYQAGVIYRGERIVNWCPRCHSTLADDEVEHQEQKAKLYTFRYWSDFPIAISTTRPETKLGDTAVAVNPQDKRYQKFIGQEFSGQFCGQPLKIKIIGDRQVDMNFGTGAVGVTPAHSLTDWKMAEEHDLPIKKVIDENGKIRTGFGEFSGLSAKDAAEKIVARLKKEGLLLKEEEIDNALSVCYRCQTAIEPLPSRQWFVNVHKKLKRLRNKSLREKAMEVVESGEIEFIPARFRKRYLHWMENLHDWCISRQIWFGHRIPVWYKKDNPQEIYVGTQPPADQENWQQDPDVLDTWFSSGMWTFSTLGWPDTFQNGQKTGDLARFHPTQVLETGYEIITLWVSRMIMMSLFALQEIPFEKVYLHGMVLDEQGQKMSKSKGNGIDPLDVIEKFGTDAVRLSLLISNTPGNNLRLGEAKIEGFRNLVNKIWNITRYLEQKYVFSELKKPLSLSSLSTDLTLADKWLLARFAKTIKEVTTDLNNYRLSEAGEKLKEFTWNELADWYLEISKVETENAATKKAILFNVWRDLLKLWHPFIPFVTETIWQEIFSVVYPQMLMVEKWPEATIYPLAEQAITDFSLLQDIIVALRNVRARYRLKPQQKMEAVIYAHQKTALLQQGQPLLKNLQTGLSELKISTKGPSLSSAHYEVIRGVEIYVPLAEIIDLAAEKKRLTEELQKTEKFLQALEQKLNNQNFLTKAPVAVVNKEKQKLETQKEKFKQLKQYLANLS